MNNKAQLQKTLLAAQNVFITTHAFPDADGICAQIALMRALKKRGKRVICVNEEELAPRYHYLNDDEIIQCLKKTTLNLEDYDLFIALDTHALERTGKEMSKLLRPQQDKLIFIDHHTLKEKDPQRHFIDTEASSTGELIGHLLVEMGEEIDFITARALYTAILVDTSSFRYPNVRGRTHELLAQLLRAGVSPTQTYLEIYGTKTIRHMHLLGAILSAAKIDSSGEIAWLIVSDGLIEHYGAKKEDTLSYINHLLNLENIKVACMFTLGEDEEIKVSLRSPDVFDVSQIAAYFGGGGHPFSAAFSQRGKVDELVEKVISHTQKKLQKTTS